LSRFRKPDASVANEVVEIHACGQSVTETARDFGNEVKMFSRKFLYTRAVA
jgi:hypothetical protein